jgi:hypothetical protein
VKPEERDGEEPPPPSANAEPEGGNVREPEPERFAYVPSREGHQSVELVAAGRQRFPNDQIAMPASRTASSADRRIRLGALGPHILSWSIRVIRCRDGSWRMA